MLDMMGAGAGVAIDMAQIHAEIPRGGPPFKAGIYGA